MSALHRIGRGLGVLVGSLAIALVAPAGAAASVPGSPADADPAAGLPPGTHYPILLTEMSISTGYAYFPAGQVTFDIRNIGKVTHELVVIRTDVAPGLIPIDATSPDKASEVGAVGEADDLAPGTSATLTLTLAPGRYAFICNEPGHFAAGMHSGFTAATFVSITEKEMLIGLDTLTVPAGPVVFSVTNSGTLTHELVVLKTNVAADKIPSDATDPSRASEDGDVGEVQDIDAGRFSGNALDLAAGKYVLICNEPGHYAAGMRIAFTVQ